jgi:hypothetical protein
MNILVMLATWLMARKSEPSTYQGMSVLAGIAGKFFLNDEALGQQILEVGLAVAAVIQTGKYEPVQGRDF